MEPKNKQTALIQFLNRERETLLIFLHGKFHDLSEMDLEDLISDLLLSFMNKSGLTAPIENLTGYIYRAIYHRGLDLIRRRSQIVYLDQTDYADNRILGSRIPDPDQDLFAQANYSVLQDRLFEVLSKLNPKSQAVWIATELEGYSFKELADMWGEPIGTLLARKSRAAKKIVETFADLKKEE